MSWYIGMKVVCVNTNGSSGHPIIKDNIYEVEELIVNINGEGLYLKGICVLGSNGMRTAYRTRRFVPLDILNTELNIEELLSNKV